MIIKEGWTTTKLIAIGSLVALRFLLKLILYTPLLISSGNILSGILIEIIAPYFLVLSALVINQTGTATLFTLLSFIVELPLPTMFPTLILLPTRLVEGLSVDFIYHRTCSRRKLFSFLAGFVATLIDLTVTVGVFFSKGFLNVKSVPESLATPPIIGLLLVLISVTGGLSGMFALFTYEKINNMSVVKRIQKNTDEK